MCSGIPVRTFWVRLWSGITEDTCAMALLWKMAFTMTCFWMKGKCIQLFMMTFLQVVIIIMTIYNAHIVMNHESEARKVRINHLVSLL